MPENPRIEELRRRVQKDPSSIAFAQLAEEYRKAGRYGQAIDTCRCGLERHPEYLSARVTLGRALIETGVLEAAEVELTRVLDVAPENLAAVRGLADIFHRRGDLEKALDFYRRALALAHSDPDLEQTTVDLERAIGPGAAPRDEPGGLSFDQARDELMSILSNFNGPGGRGAESAAPALSEPAAAPSGASTLPAPPVAVAAPAPASETTCMAPEAPADEIVGTLESMLDAIWAHRQGRDASS